MEEENKERPNFAYQGLQITEDQIWEAIKNTRSNHEAARWMQITYITYKKYANKYIDRDTGKTLFEVHKNQASKGIPKNFQGSNFKRDLNDMLTEKQVSNPQRIAKLKDLLMKDGRLGYCCAECGFKERRILDMKVPLLINFINGNKSDWRIENLRWLCYNCSFLFAVDPFSDRITRNIESKYIHDEEVLEENNTKFYDLDPFYLEHLERIGYDDKGNLNVDDIIDYK